MINRGSMQGLSAKDKVMNTWFEELVLPVAPACNMTCNFCSKDSDCICNANDPGTRSKVMTPRQAVNWAVSCANKNKRIRVIKITGPGEPLFNAQTFDVLKRLNSELPDYIYSVSTNGLLLKDKVKELLRLNVKIVEVSLNSLQLETGSKMYSRLSLYGFVLTEKNNITSILLDNQKEGIRLCVENGIAVRVNTVYLPGVNDKDVINISNLCRTLGVESMRLISAGSEGKLKGVRTPAMNELNMFCEALMKNMQSVEIKSFSN